MSERPIRFVHRGRIVEHDAAEPTRSVLQWLREDARCTGTKEGCAEGDCGACTVLVAELAPPGASAATVVDGLQLRPVNSCIRFLPTLHGKALITVEDLGSADALHPVQQAMVDCHGSQCGFCTPGFVMSLAERYEHHCETASRPSRQALADSLAGNLCRCTGYRPILDAGQRMFDLPVQRLNTAPIVALLQQLQADPAPALQRDGGGFHAPRTVAALAQLLAAKSQARILAGGTDIGLWVNKQFRALGEVVYVGDVAELKQLQVQGAELHIGAAVPLEDAWAALTSHWPDLREAWLRFAGPPVRHAGTLGGNVANGSPIGDGAPVLMALGARLKLQRGDVQRELALEDFYLGYMKNALQPGEFLHSMVLPLPRAGQQLRAWKLSKRFDCDISALFAAFVLEVQDGTVADARFVFGGMAAVVKHAAGAEAAVRGQPWSEATLRAAQAALAQDFQPLTDLRASSDYRTQAAQGLLRRLWLQTRAEAPLSDAHSTVWALAAAAS